MFFWWICGGESGLSVLFLRHLSPSPSAIIFKTILLIFSFSSLSETIIICIVYFCVGIPQVPKSLFNYFYSFCFLSSPEKYMCVCVSFSFVWLFATPWTVPCQAPQSMGFSRQEYWSGLPWPSPGDLPNPGIKPSSPALQAGSLPSKPPGKHREMHRH